MLRSLLRRLALVTAVAVGALLVSPGRADAGWHHWHRGYWYAPYVTVYSPLVYAPLVYAPPVYAPLAYDPWCCNTWTTRYWASPARYGCGCCGYGCSVCSGWYARSYTYLSDPCCDGVIVSSAPVATAPAAAAPEAAAPPAADRSLLTPKAPAKSTLKATPRAKAAAPAADSPPPPPASDLFPGPAETAPKAVPDESFRAPTGSGVLAVEVPADAKVYVNGLLTKTPGTLRRYVSRGLYPGYRYTYEVRAEWERDGQPMEATRVVQLQAGQTAELAFDLPAPSTQLAATTLTLRVPEDAAVTLAGRPTRRERGRAAVHHHGAGPRAAVGELPGGRPGRTRGPEAEPRSDAHADGWPAAGAVVRVRRRATGPPLIHLNGGRNGERRAMAPAGAEPAGSAAAGRCSPPGGDSARKGPDE